MTICKGVVKDNMVLLEAGAQLPDGAEVEVQASGTPREPGRKSSRVSALIASCVPPGWDEILAGG